MFYKRLHSCASEVLNCKLWMKNIDNIEYSVVILFFLINFAVEE